MSAADLLAEIKAKPTVPKVIKWYEMRFKIDDKERFVAVARALATDLDSDGKATPQFLRMIVRLIRDPPGYLYYVGKTTDTFIQSRIASHLQSDTALTSEFMRHLRGASFPLKYAEWKAQNGVDVGANIDVEGQLIADFVARGEKLMNVAKINTAPVENFVRDNLERSLPTAVPFNDE